MSSSSTEKKKEKVILSNKVLTNIVSSNYERYFNLEADVKSIKSQLKTIHELFGEHGETLTASRNLCDISEAELRELVRIQDRHIQVLRARVSLLEGRTSGTVSSLDSNLNTEKPHIFVNPPVFTPKNPFSQNGSSSSKSLAQPKTDTKKL